MLARRATPMYLVDDIAEARSRYEALGFEPKLTDDTGCLGVSAGPTNVILLNRDYAQRTLPARAVALLEERPALYVWVESLDAVRDALRGDFLGETRLAGLREWAVESEHGLMVFAETTRPH
jgi:hypothetical protein